MYIYIYIYIYILKLVFWFSKNTKTPDKDTALETNINLFINTLTRSDQKPGKVLFRQYPEKFQILKMIFSVLPRLFLSKTFFRF